MKDKFYTQLGQGTVMEIFPKHLHPEHQLLRVRWATTGTNDWTVTSEEIELEPTPN